MEFSPRSKRHQGPADQDETSDVEIGNRSEGRSLGAGRAHLVKQLLTECVALGLAAAPLGLAIAYFGVWLLNQAVPPDQVPPYLHWEISVRGIAYTVIVSAMTGRVFGVAPVLQAGRLNLQETLRDGARGSGRSRGGARLRNGLVVLEVAVAVVLLVGASLFVRSFVNLQSASPGFDTAPLLTARFFMTGDKYAADEQEAQRVDDIMRRVEALPGVVAAFASNFVPLDEGGASGHAKVDGRDVPKGEEPAILFTAVTPHLYRTMGLSILKGRDFLDAEGASRTPVAVINETMADRLWPGADAVGRRFRPVEAEPAEWLTVIGMAPDIGVVDRNDRPPIAVAYVPYRFGGFENIGLTIRAASNDPAGLMAVVRREVHASDGSLPIFNVRTMEDLRQASFWRFRIFAYMFGIFGHKLGYFGPRSQRIMANSDTLNNALPSEKVFVESVFYGVSFSRSDKSVRRFSRDELDKELLDEGVFSWIDVQGGDIGVWPLISTIPQSCRALSRDRRF